MIARALIVLGAVTALLTASWGGLAVYVVLFTALMLVIGAAHRGRYR